MKVTEMRRNAYVIENFETKEVILQSYNSTIAIIDKESGYIKIGKHWDYSVTTLKHVYQFLENYAQKIPEAFYESRTKKRSVEKMIKLGLIEYDENLV